MFVFKIRQADRGVISASTEDMVDALFRGSLADCREFLSLLRARLCLSCGEPRTGTFTECPMCWSTYTKDP